MDTEVYFLCQLCGGITNGTGSGDPRDEIRCVNCGERKISIKLCYCEIKSKKKALYIPGGAMKKIYIASLPNIS